MGMMRDPYLYPNTEVLKNKFSVIDNEKLNTIEAEYTSTSIRIFRILNLWLLPYCQRWKR